MSGAHQPPPRRGFVSRLLAWILGAVFWLCCALVFSVAAELVGMVFWWPEQGAEHARGMLAAEARYLGADSPLRAAVVWVAGVVRSWGVGALVAPWPQVAGYVQAAELTVLVFAARLAVLVLSSPVLVLATVVGVVEGAVARELRRHTGAHERAYWHHRVRRLIAPALVAPVVLYLSVPVTLHPAAVVGPAAVVLGWSVSSSLASFKKHL